MTGRVQRIGRTHHRFFNEGAKAHRHAEVGREADRAVRRAIQFEVGTQAVRDPGKLLVAINSPNDLAYAIAL